MLLLSDCRAVTAPASPTSTSSSFHSSPSSSSSSSSGVEMAVVLVVVVAVVVLVVVAVDCSMIALSLDDCSVMRESVGCCEKKIRGMGD